VAIRSVKEHLQHHHSRSASFDIATGAELEKLAKVFERLETQADDDTAKAAYRDGKESIRQLSAAFNVHAEHHKSMMMNAEKSADIDDLDKLAPTGISAVYDPSKSPTGSRLVPRAGQRELSSMPQVAQGFENLVKVGDDRE